MNKTIFNVLKQIQQTNISLNKADVYHILEHILNKDYQWIISNLDYLLTKRQVYKLDQILELLKQNYPLAYILKSKYFYSYKFFVNKDVLIPRNESELMIDYASEFIKNNDDLLIVDLCTGSGCLGISCALLNQKNKVILTDISYKALKVANKNIKKFNLTNTSCLSGNFIDVLIKNNLKANLIICNPPYIDINDKNLDKNVVNFEPNIALFAPNNGLYFYEVLIKNIDKIVDTNKNFLIVLEFGWLQKDSIEQLLVNNCLKYKYEFKKDYNGYWRNLIIKNF
ncbi:peptide chain release factor N(5)-glutamine methyltransferase [Mycoplasma feriruminatoris]|uniref:Release factor glutamine methyltransferase n=1 Tax=Mycoplasma feriruminatoris TaxID=1179777 RepID=A0A654IN72_9MOLU|nr:peptide chain release factor N(5)-glutamine methyltransferase [Mycoplasma feriruminatoris]WFQ89906.1 Release factor glutamine methyltransferase [Mycoplasma feriruminatoris]WFQ90727.1 protoporphyrinogen oxidase [Mycoplasma feriruminatoris]WFQ93243.1 protoporphyrinogen oxidase [Mycoplasma feriruminatoris]WFQ94080.1 Release factor glutamine methyltransferase [Mycoplasma feriruminatoris]WFQ94900.1 protoporphyrinogen oxidase [Mycoplasma feriruminatoris]